MGVRMDELIADLGAETAVLDGMVASLEPVRWATPTPAVGWDIADQVAHLAYFDEAAITAATDPERFAGQVEAALAGGVTMVDQIAESLRGRTPASLLTWLRTSRAELADVFGGLDPKVRVPWFGPPMSAASSVTARLMETWAHGQDIADALGVTREPTARLRHVAMIGARALPYSFMVNGLPVPAEPVRVELTLPGGEPWAYGPEGTPDVVRGSALDFCLVVTQRRHLDDTALTYEGPAAEAWMPIAQAFAGPAGPGREAGAGR